MSGYTHTHTCLQNTQLEGGLPLHSWWLKLSLEKLVVGANVLGAFGPLGVTGKELVLQSQKCGKLPQPMDCGERREGGSV